MDNKGYILIWRKIEHSGLLQSPNTFALFSYLLLKATHQDIKVNANGEIVELKRGQYIAGRLQLARDLKQSEREIRTGLDKLKKLGIISQKTTNKYSIYTIEKYSEYQNPASKESSKRPASDQQATTKQTQDTQNTNTYSEEFELFWKEYPNHNGKAGAYKSWLKKNPDINIVMAALSWQKKSLAWTKDNGQYVPMAQTYINNERWNDEAPAPRKLELVY